MTEQMIYPKVCAKCGQVCDRFEGRWVHVSEVVGMPGHPAEPVDYGAVPLVARCDFCYRIVELNERWLVPASDFQVPLIKSWSLGGWCCDEVCAKIAETRDWAAMIERHFASPETATPAQALYVDWITATYAKLDEHITGEVRPFRAGDEKVPAEPKTQ